jgi:uncharacterized membrane protein
MTPLARTFFALPIAVFGLQYILYGHWAGGLPPVPPWTPGGATAAYIVGALLLAAGLSMLANRKARLSAIFVGAFFLLSVLFLQLQHASEVWNDGVARTRALEPLALSGAAFVLAAMLPADSSARVNSAASRFALCGRLLFAIPMIPFGYQHFIYAPFIATLIPAWIPGHLFFAYFTGAAFIAAAAAILAKIQAPLAANLLALMFFLWVVVLHAPRVAAQPHNGDEWTSLFIALAFCGGSLLIASSMAKSHRRIS